MPNPNIAEAGKATRFKKGNVPISPGRPKKTLMSEAYGKHLGDRLPEEVRIKLGLPKAATWADAIAVGQIRSAVKGKTDAAREIADRTEGRAVHKLALTDPKGGAFSRIEIITAARKRVARLREERWAASQPTPAPESDQEGQP